MNFVFSHLFAIRENVQLKAVLFNVCTMMGILLMPASFWLYAWILFEFYLAYRRKRLLLDTICHAISRRDDTGERIVVLGCIPEMYRSETLTALDTDDTILDFLQHGTENTIVIENDYLAKTDRFQEMKDPLARLAAHQLFIVPRSFLSLTAYLDFVQVPRRVFICYPPWNRYIYVLANPVAKCQAYLTILLLSFSTLRGSR